MKIYQIIESSGPYYDYREEVIETHLSKEKAEIKMNELILEEEYIMKKNQECISCIGIHLKQQQKKQCFKHDSDCNANCQNYIWFDEDYKNNYKIKEFEVIE